MQMYSIYSLPFSLSSFSSFPLFLYSRSSFFLLFSLLFVCSVFVDFDTLIVFFWLRNWHIPKKGRMREKETWDTINESFKKKDLKIGSRGRRNVLRPSFWFDQHQNENRFKYKIWVFNSFSKMKNGLILRIFSEQEGTRIHDNSEEIRKGGRHRRCVGKSENSGTIFSLDVSSTRVRI